MTTLMINRVDISTCRACFFLFWLIQTLVLPFALLTQKPAPDHHVNSLCLMFRFNVYWSCLNILNNTQVDSHLMPGFSINLILQIGANRFGWVVECLCPNTSSRILGNQGQISVVDFPPTPSPQPGHYMNIPCNLVPPRYPLFCPVKKFPSLADTFSNHKQNKNKLFQYKDTKKNIIYMYIITFAWRPWHFPVLWKQFSLPLPTSSSAQINIHKDMSVVRTESCVDRFLTST